ncbi:MOSC domain-containing protein [Paenibacillus cremeus]|uniref:MOSC domain-containing protein n=1 Tax=Paenibacillus cremeus TaxID=2163881 RepID=A0A559K0B9_9BACL|nr:MOSC domain-containing protein [Paenibacillus cremeus]TVY05537.1 MOSC domain-containing protein [Paenibacillus cremeus]
MEGKDRIGRACLVRLESLNVSKPVTVEYNGKSLETGIYKEPVSGSVFLSRVNLEGDGQADLVYHGGEDKAVCVYCSEHYPYWEERLDGKLSGSGAFGENFTVSGMTESELCIGDVFGIGEAVVQVSQPRQPCFKLAVKHGVTDLPAQVQATGYTGYYFRVLQEGRVEAGQPFRLMERDALGVTVAEANRLKYHDKQDVEGVRKLLQVKALSASWRESFERRLEEK